MRPQIIVDTETTLKVGRFRERTAGMNYSESPLARGDFWDLTLTEPLWSDPGDLAPHIAGLLQGATLIAANPTFDAGFLTAFLTAYGCDPSPWHYRLRDIGSMAWAWLQAHHLPHHLDTPPMDTGTDDFARALGIDPNGFERHSALGDCRLVAAMLDVIEGGAP